MDGCLFVSLSHKNHRTDCNETSNVGSCRFEMMYTFYLDIALVMLVLVILDDVRLVEIRLYDVKYLLKNTLECDIYLFKHIRMFITEILYQPAITWNTGINL